MELLVTLLTLALASSLWLCANGLPSRAGPLLAALPALVGLALVSRWAPAVWQGEVPTWTWAWFPTLGIELGLRLDGLGLLMALLILGIGAGVTAYTASYMGPGRDGPRLLAYLYFFMAAMLGVVVADHLLALFLFWELTSVASYLLIGFQAEDNKARKHALQALLTTGLGGLALLGAVILMAQVGGSWSLTELRASGFEWATHAAYPAIVLLVFLAAFTKSAQYPFHYWLPNAMVAPTPVSAYLHSATMVKAGVFLLAILNPLLGGTPLWENSLLVVGGVTFLWGGLLGLLQDDLKKVLAYTTLAVLGLLVFLLGLGTEGAALAMVVTLLAHAFYKAALFLVVGAIDHETGSRDRHLLAGLRFGMPVTATAALLAGLSKMGLPPFVGFLGKEFLYKAGETLWLPLGVLVIGNVLLFVLAFRVALRPFWARPRPESPQPHHEAPVAMWVVPLALGIGGLLAGLLAETALYRPVSVALSSITLGAPAPKLALWQGVNLALILSVLSVGLALLFIWQSRALDRLTARAKTWPMMEQVYGAALNGLAATATWQTRLFQSGQLRNYLLMTILASLLLVLLPLAAVPEGFPAVNLEAVSPFAFALVLAMIVASLYAAITCSRLGALVAIGVVGWGVALIFALHGAPDLAITQILVETLTVVLFALAVYRLPVMARFSRVVTRIGDGVFAAAAGSLLALLVLLAVYVEVGPPLAAELAERSLPEAFGRNVVNVILVDFRALDTLGEIGVLAIASLGVWALVRQWRKEVAR